MNLLHPHFIKFEKPKNELNFTFSAVVDKKENKRILDIQKETIKIIKKEEMLKDLEIEKKRNGFYKRIARGDRFIYKYPSDRLHFSIVNFTTYDIISLKDFDKARGAVEKTTNFRKLKTKIKNFKKLFLQSLENKFKEVMIRRIYLPAGIEGSLALNAFPTKKEFFINLEKIVKETRKKMNTKELPISHNLEIKAYPKENYQYFALNIFRFIDRDDIPINRKDNFYKKIEKVNSKLKKNPIKIKMKPCIVISDPYLANDKPQIDC
jgi:hypothetical protein